MGVTLNKSINRDVDNIIDISTPYNELNVKANQLVEDVVSHIENELNSAETQVNTQLANLDNTITETLDSKNLTLQYKNETENLKNQTIEAVSVLYGNAITDKIFTIGTMGELGFGVGAIPHDKIPSGFLPMSGHYDVASENYGNLVDATGSIMVAIPKFYYRIVGNEILISATQLSGYVIHRMFINAGQELDYVLVDKYGCGNVNGVFTSKAGIDPCSTHSSHNSIALLNNTPNQNYGGLYKAVKTRSDKHFLTSMFIYNGLALLAKAHSDKATTTTCAFNDVAPYMPKGCNNNALKDTNDSSVVYASSGYSNCGLTGAVENFAKTTHNGQKCGVADLNGNMYEVASGFTRFTSNGFLVLKESVDISSILDDSTTQSSGGAYDIDLYDTVDISDLVPEDGSLNGWIKFGNIDEQVFAFSTDRNSNDYKRTSIGMPLATGVSSSGTTEFGNDGLYRYLRDQMACLVGLYWGSGSVAGVFGAYLNNARHSSSDTVGGRASYNVSL